MQRVILGLAIALGLATYSAPSAAEPIIDAAPVDETASPGRVDRVFGVNWCHGDVPQLVDCDVRTDVIRRDIHHSVLLPEKSPSASSANCETNEITWLAAMGKAGITMPPELLASMSPVGQSGKELIAGVISCPLAVPPTVIM